MDFNKVLTIIQENDLSIGILDIKPSKTAIDIAKKISKQLKDGVDVDKVIFEYLKSQGRTKTGRLGQEIKNQLYSLGLITKQQALGNIKESKEDIDYDVKEVDISQIRIGDTVKHNGKIMTVSKNDIKKDDFMGITLFGDSYALGNKKVKKVEIKKKNVKESIKSNGKTFTPEEAKKEVAFLKKAIKETNSKAMKSEYTNKLNNLLNSMEDNNINEGWKKIKNVEAKDATSKVKEFFSNAKVRRGTDEENEYVVDGKVIARYNILDNMLLIKEALTPEQQKKEQLKKAAIEAAKKKYPNLSDDDFDYDETSNTVRKLTPVEKAKLKTLKIK